MSFLTMHKKNGEEYKVFNGIEVSIPPKPEQLDRVIKDLKGERESSYSAVGKKFSFGYFFFEKNILVTLSIFLSIAIIVGTHFHLTGDPETIRQLQFAKDLNDPMLNSFNTISTIALVCNSLVAAIMLIFLFVSYALEKKNIEESKARYDLAIEHFEKLRDEALRASKKGSFIDFKEPPSFYINESRSLNNTSCIWLIFACVFSLKQTIPYNYIPVEVVEKQGLVEKFEYSVDKSSYVLTYIENGRTQTLTIPSALEGIKVTNNAETPEQKTFNVYWRTHGGKYTKDPRYVSDLQVVEVNLGKNEKPTLIDNRI